MEHIRTLYAPKGYLQFFAEGEAADASTSTETTEVTDSTEQTDSKEDALTKEYIEKLIQSEVDKVRTRYTKELKTKEKELENLRTASMTAQEKADYEFQRLQDELQQREQTLLQKEMRSLAIDQLTASELDVAFVDFVVGKDEEDTKQRAEVFKKTFGKALEKAVEARFKAAGRDITLGNSAGGGFTREQVNKMSKDEINANWPAIQQAMRSWR